MTRQLALLLICMACSAPKGEVQTPAGSDGDPPRDTGDTGPASSEDGGSDGGGDDLPIDKVGGGFLQVRSLTEDGTVLEELEIPGVPEANLVDIWPNMSRINTDLNSGAGIYEEPGIYLGVIAFQTGIWAPEDYTAEDPSSSCAVDWDESCETAQWHLYFQFDEETSAFFFNQANLSFGLLQYDANPRLDEGASGGELVGGPAESTSGSAFALGPQIINADNCFDEDAEITLMRAMIEARWPGLHRMEFTWAFDPEVAIRH
jgi:hypothetical protein